MIADEKDELFAFRVHRTPNSVPSLFNSCFETDERSGVVPAILSEPPVARLGLSTSRRDGRIRLTRKILFERVSISGIAEVGLLAIRSWKRFAVVRFDPDISVDWISAVHDHVPAFDRA